MLAGSKKGSTQDVHMGYLVLLPTPALDPHGAMLSTSADHGRSGGHMKAAGPIVRSPSSLPTAYTSMQVETTPTNA
jgi:hypothetical protein